MRIEYEKCLTDHALLKAERGYSLRVLAVTNVLFLDSDIRMLNRLRDEIKKRGLGGFLQGKNI